MKVSLRKAGGFTGMATTTEVDSAELAPEHAQQLQEKVRDSGVFDLSEEIAASSQQARDVQSYSLTVEDEQGERTISLPQTDVPEPVRELISFVDSVPGRKQTVGGLIEPQGQ